MHFFSRNAFVYCNGFLFFCIATTDTLTHTLIHLRFSHKTKPRRRKKNQAFRRHQIKSFVLPLYFQHYFSVLIGIITQSVHSNRYLHTKKRTRRLIEKEKTRAKKRLCMCMQGDERFFISTLVTIHSDLNLLCIVRKCGLKIFAYACKSVPVELQFAI